MNLLLKPSNLGLPSDNVTRNNLKSIATFLYYIYLYEITQNICPAHNKIDDTLFVEKLDAETKIKTPWSATVGDSSVVEELMDLSKIENLVWSNE